VERDFEPNKVSWHRRIAWRRPWRNGRLQRGIVGGTRRTCADPSSEVEIATPGPRQHPIQLTIQHYRMSFSDVCQLFEELASLSVNQAVKRENVVRRWFRQHESNFPGRGPAGLALMSCLFPEKRPEPCLRFSGTASGSCYRENVRFRTQPNCWTPPTARTTRPGLCFCGPTSHGPNGRDLNTWWTLIRWGDWEDFRPSGVNMSLLSITTGLMWMPWVSWNTVGNCCRTRTLNCLLSFYMRKCSCFIDKGDAVATATSCLASAGPAQLNPFSWHRSSWNVRHLEWQPEWDHHGTNGETWNGNS